MVERIFIITPGNILTASSFSQEWQVPGKNLPKQQNPSFSEEKLLKQQNFNSQELKPPTLHEAMVQYEQTLIAEAISRNQGNITRAAKELGISRTGLYKKLAK